MTDDQSLGEEYAKYHNKYAEIYGKDKMVVLMQVGSFYEAYGTDTEGPDLKQLSQLTGVIRSRKKTDSPLSMSHPYFFGFPMNAFVKYLDMLIENNYVVVVMDQIPSINKNKKGEKRQVTNIYSRGTYIDNLDKKEGNYIACAYFSYDDQKNSKPLLSVGLTAIDVSTGHVYIHESYSTKYDECIALDETDRFFSSIEPTEIIIYYQDNTKETKNDKTKSKMKSNIEYVMNYLKLNLESVRIYDNVDTKYSQINFQNEILKKVYPASKSLISPVQYLCLEKNIYSVTSLVLTFDFIFNRDDNLLNKLVKPIYFMNDHSLALGNNAIRQLDILENRNDNQSKYKSLFHVINKTSTALGERFLKVRMISPLTNIKKLNKTYSCIDEMITNDFYKEVEKILDGIKDLERLVRKMQLQRLRPYEIPMLVDSYESVFQLIKLLKDNNEIDELNEMIPDDKIVIDSKKMVKYINKIFDMQELKKYTNFDIMTPIFNKGIHKDLDEVTDNVDYAQDFIEDLAEALDKLINDKNDAKKMINSKNNKKDGHYLLLTVPRGKKLQDIIKSKKSISLGNDKTIEPSVLEFKIIGNNMKIFFPSLDKKTDDIEKYQKKLLKLNKKYFLEELTEIHDKFSHIFSSINNFISNIDFIKSGAKVAKLFGYSRPIICKKDYGYINATQLRHPIIERIIDYEYVPLDIKLGTEELKGITLFGENAAGKSSSMKAIGINVILAQCGLFVSAQRFVYSPYHALYTRISGDDNLFRGLSSFTLEMVEVNAILKRSDDYTLVIGDEVCRGTEHISGTAIVAATLLKLSQSGATFIFATHLHELMELNEIKELKNVAAYHINVTYDEKSDSLIYDRQLKKGSGEKLYGIKVARYIIQDNEFIDMATKIKNELLEQYDSMISGKKSNYNKNMFVYECHLCGQRDKISHVSNLETHHINFQKNCKDGLVEGKQHIKKNQESNLIVLCTSCHDKLHAGKMILGGYVMTSNGKSVVMTKNEN